VALSTISDVMMLTGDNRSLVMRGLHLLTQAHRGNSGLKALLDVLKLRKSNVSLTAERIAFSICPCINAAGRLGREALKDAFRLLMLPPASHALPGCAQTLLAFNEKRRKIEHDLTLHIEKTTQLQPHQPLAIAGTGEIFHPGVIGIVAARLMERLQAPVAVIEETKSGGHGSMRAGEGYNAIAILKYLEGHLDHFGGHAQAAGFTIKEGHLEAFVRAFPQACLHTHEPSDQHAHLVDIDLSMVPITLPLCSALTRLEPYGHGNPRPLFVKRFEVRSKRIVGSDGVHLSLFLKPDDGSADLKAVWFNGAERAKHLKIGDSFRAIFSLDLDTYNPARPVPSVRIVQCI
jgi:single-stranded-DNA-specific exonuclease